tara:strand:+ start:24894 stop:25235 length:342 start_codon:yes stop_codon:yes gene_type:complete
MTTKMQKILDRDDKQWVDFEIADDKGRALGMIVIRAVETRVERPTDSETYVYGYPLDALGLGSYPAAYVITARDGAMFGASQNWKAFATIGERDAYIEKRISETRARYAKKFA